MEFNIRLKGVEEALRTINPGNVIKAAKKTIRRAAGSGKTIISSQIRKKFNLKKSDVDRKINLDLSEIQNCKATLTVTGKPISLMYFNPFQIRGMTKRYLSRGAKGMTGSIARDYGKGKGGVHIKILQKKGKTVLRRAFIARGRGGTAMVFRTIPRTISQRTKKEKLAAYKIITHASILKQKENLDAVIKRIDEQLLKEWNQNIKHFGKE